MKAVVYELWDVFSGKVQETTDVEVVERWMKKAQGKGGKLRWVRTMKRR